jgi:hypothetical protein
MHFTIRWRSSIGLARVIAFLLFFYSFFILYPTCRVAVCSKHCCLPIKVVAEVAHPCRLLLPSQMQYLEEGGGGVEEGSLFPGLFVCLFVEGASGRPDGPSVKRIFKETDF